MAYKEHPRMSFAGPTAELAAERYIAHQKREAEIRASHQPTRDDPSIEYEVRDTITGYTEEPKQPRERVAKFRRP